MKVFPERGAVCQQEDAACWMATADAAKFTNTPGVTEKSYHLRILIPDEVLPVVEQVLENRKNWGKTPGYKVHMGGV
jgi:hypothetical protein